MNSGLPAQHTPRHTRLMAQLQREAHQLAAQGAAPPRAASAPPLQGGPGPPAKVAPCSMHVSAWSTCALRPVPGPPAGMSRGARMHGGPASLPTTTWSPASPIIYKIHTTYFFHEFFCTILQITPLQVLLYHPPHTHTQSTIGYTILVRCCIICWSYCWAHIFQPSPIPQPAALHWYPPEAQPRDHLL